jgi:hypothetical protein
MSAKTTGIIWDLVLPAPQRMVLLSMVDHADHDGGHIHAPIPFIAWKTGYSARNTARIIQDLIDAGLLTITKQGLGESNEYQFDLSCGVFKPPYKGRKPKTQPTTHDKMSGVKERTHAKMAGVTHDKMSGVVCDSPPTHDKMASPHDKMSGVTHDKMAIDSISTIVGVGDHVGVGDRARDEKTENPEFVRQLCARRAHGKPMNSVSAQRIAALVATGQSDEPTVLASLDALIADNTPMNVIVGLLNNNITIPPKGQPYERRPTQPDDAPNRQRSADPAAAAPEIKRLKRTW